MQDENLHKVILQKPKREAITILKKSFSCLASYLKRLQRNPSTDPTTELEEPVVSTAVQGKYTATRCPSPTRELVEIAEENALTIGVSSLSISTSTTSLSNPKPHTTIPNPTNPCTNTISSSSRAPTSTPQANMQTHTQHRITQPTDSLSSSSTNTNEGNKQNHKSHSTNTTKLPLTPTHENQKRNRNRNIQEILIKNLILKLTKERREKAKKEFKLRNSRRIRYLAAVKKMVRKSWSISRSHAMTGSRLGRKRKLEEQCI